MKFQPFCAIEPIECLCDPLLKFSHYSTELKKSIAFYSIHAKTHLALALPVYRTDAAAIVTDLSVDWF